MRISRAPALVVAVASLVLVTAPAAPADPTRPAITQDDVTNAGRPCATAGDRPLRTGYFAGELDAVARRDGALLAGAYRFAIWAVGHKNEATSFAVHTDDPDRAARVSVPSDVLQDGTHYAWHVRYSGATGRSAWSPTCLFTYDVTRPATPTITPTNFPDPQTAPVATFADFHLDSNGSADVIAYEYTWNDVLPVPGCSYDGPQGQLECGDPLAGVDAVTVTRTDGDAEARLSPPDWGPNYLIVRSVDAAGNVSPTTEYDFYVQGSGPQIAVVTPSPVCGPQVRLRFTADPRVTGVTSYTYSLGSGPERSVAARRNGSVAVTVPLSNFGAIVHVHTTSADGYDSTEAVEYLRTDPDPFVFGDVYTEDAGPEGGVGVTGTFDIYPPQGFDPALDTLTYRFSDGTSGTVPADTGEITWTPAAPGPVSLVVAAADGSGAPVGCGTTYSFEVAG